MTRYFASDLHLGHANIIDHCDRPFKSVEEMNQALISSWNAEIDPDDVVLFLGDLGHFADEDALRRWLAELNGRIVFIEGNHDHPSRYTDGVQTHQYYILKRGDREFCCTHRPENAPRFWDGWVFHGHHHNSDLEAYPLVNPTTQQANLSIELTGYRPLSEDTLIELIDRGERIARLDCND